MEALKLTVSLQDVCRKTISTVLTALTVLMHRNELH